MAAAAALLLFGCSDAGGGSGEAAPEDGGVAVDEGAADGAGETGGVADPQVSAGERAVVYESALEVEDPDPDRVAEDVWDLAASFGGYVTADERDLTATEDGGVAGTARLTMRIPSEHFQEAMDGLTALAETEVGRSVTTEDVTEAVVDLESYIATKSASVDRVRQLLADADSVSAILDLESELATREGELASLQQQLAELEERIALSTIDFTVTAPEAVRAEEGYTGPDSFWDGLVVGFDGALGLLVGLSVALGVILPFLPLIALGFAAVLLPLRWRAKRRRAAPPLSPAAAPLPQAPPPRERV
ncbi:DUF4349 domain-containing protein [Glycomyces sp. NPDC047369]